MKRTRYIILSVFSIMLLDPCLVGVELFNFIGISDDLGQLVIFANLVILLFLSKEYISLSGIQQQIILIYISVALYLIISSLFLYDDTTYIFKSFRVFFKDIVIGIICFLIINDRRINIIELNKLFVTFAFVFCFLSLILYFGFLFGNIDLKAKILPGSITPRMRGYFLGYLDSVNKNFLLLRNQSFWSEPAKFAQFLVIPLFITLKLYQNKKSIRNAIVLVTISLSFVLTFSVANFYGVIISLILFSFLVSTKFNSTSSNKQFVGIIGVIILLIIGFYFYEVTQESSTTNILGKNLSQHVDNREERFGIAVKTLDYSYFGDLKLYSNYHINTTAIGQLIMVGGIPAIIFITIAIYIFFKMIFKDIRIKKSFIAASAIAFFIAFTWYGNYLGIYFIFILGYFTRMSKSLMTKQLNSNN